MGEMSVVLYKYSRNCAVVVVAVVGVVVVVCMMWCSLVWGVGI